MDTSVHHHTTRLSRVHSRTHDGHSWVHGLPFKRFGSVLDNIDAHEYLVPTVVGLNPQFIDSFSRSQKIQIPVILNKKNRFFYAFVYVTKYGKLNTNKLFKKYKDHKIVLIFL